MRPPGAFFRARSQTRAESGRGPGASGTAQFEISEKEEAKIAAFCQIAKHNGNTLTLSELLQATSMAATEEDFERAWNLNATLSARYALDAGLILERGEDGPLGTAELERESVRRSARNLGLASEFAGLCVDGRVRLLAVAGGNSYRRAGPRDDIDLFCVTAKDSLWVFMLRSLLLARLYRSSRKRTAPFCFSYALDERSAQEEFARARDGLFARDALMAHVIHGDGFYLSLIRASGWMNAYFPNLYALRTAGTGPTGRGDGAGIAQSRPADSILNSFLYYTLGTYIRLKAFLLNGRYRKRGNTSAVFRATVSKDRCVYESNRYRRLRRMYDAQLTASGGARA